MAPCKFWIVWNPEGRGPSSSFRRFGNPIAAQNHAIRLARKNPGQNFYLMEAMEGCAFNKLAFGRVEVKALSFVTREVQSTKKSRRPPRVLAVAPPLMLGPGVGEVEEAVDIQVGV